MDYKKYIVEKLLPLIEGMTEEELYELIALPPNTEMGDYALPCFKLAKLLRYRVGHMHLVKVDANVVALDDACGNTDCGGLGRNLG